MSDEKLGFSPGSDEIRKAPVIQEAEKAFQYVQRLNFLNPPVELQLLPLVRLVKATEEFSDKGLPLLLMSEPEEQEIRKLIKTIKDQQKLYLPDFWQERLAFIDDFITKYHTSDEVINTSLTDIQKFGKNLQALVRLLIDFNDELLAERSSEQQLLLPDGVDSAIQKINQDPLLSTFSKHIMIKNDLWTEAKNPTWIASQAYPQTTTGQPEIFLSYRWDRDKEYIASPAFTYRMERLKKLLGVERLSARQIALTIFFHELGHVIHGWFIKSQEIKAKTQGLPGMEIRHSIWETVEAQNIDVLMKLFSDPTPENNAVIEGFLGKNLEIITENEHLVIRVKELRNLQKTPQFYSDEQIEKMPREQLIRLAAVYKMQPGMTDEKRREFFEWKYQLPTENFADHFAVAMIKRFGF